MVVPSSQILNVMHAHLGSRYPVKELRWPSEQGVPGEVQGTLDALSSDVRQTTASLDDCADQARSYHRVAGHLLDVVSIDRPDPASVVAICKPAVLQPASVYQICCIVENACDVIKLGEPRADLVAEPKLSELSPPGPPTVNLDDVGAKCWARRNGSGRHLLTVPPQRPPERVPIRLDEGPIPSAAP
jgi:hypothetical protein